MKTATKMKEEGFTEISTIECLLREMKVAISLIFYNRNLQPKPRQQDTQYNGGVPFMLHVILLIIQVPKENKPDHPLNQGLPT
jgi:hypothetical protein